MRNFLETGKMYSDRRRPIEMLADAFAYLKFSFSFSQFYGRTQRQSVFEVRPFRYREKFGSNDLVRPGPRTDLNPRLRIGVQELAT